MKSWIVFVVLACSFATFSMKTHAASCDVQATDKKLAGAARASFVKECEKDNPAPVAVAASGAAQDTCEAGAAARKLAGAAKASYLKKCQKDGQSTSATGTCEAKAGEKKLAGAAKASFVKKCMADAGA